MECEEGKRKKGKKKGGIFGKDGYKMVGDDAYELLVTVSPLLFNAYINLISLIKISVKMVADGFMLDASAV